MIVVSHGGTHTSDPIKCLTLFFFSNRFNFAVTVDGRIVLSTDL